MAIIGGLDLHRAQIIFDHLDTETGEVRRGRIAPATRGSFRSWLATLPSAPAAFAVEACTGWRFVVEELQAAGMNAHLAEVADTMALRGPKRRAKTDKTDARHLRQLLVAGALPAAWIPPQHLLETRARIRLYKALVVERTAWQQRMKVALFHQGVPPVRALLTIDSSAASGDIRRRRAISSAVSNNWFRHGRTLAARDRQRESQVELTMRTGPRGEDTDRPREAGGVGLRTRKPQRVRARRAPVALRGRGGGRLGATHRPRLGAHHLGGRAVEAFEVLSRAHAARRSSPGTLALAVRDRD